MPCCLLHIVRPESIFCCSRRSSIGVAARIASRGADPAQVMMHRGAERDFANFFHDASTGGLTKLDRALECAMLRVEEWATPRPS
jgi:hypothetical protein